MERRYKVTSSHVEDLSSGAMVGPGDEVPASALDLNKDHDQRLIEDHALTLIPLTEEEQKKVADAEAKKAKAEEEKSRKAEAKAKAEADKNSEEGSD